MPPRRTMLLRERLAASDIKGLLSMKLQMAEMNRARRELREAAEHVDALVASHHQPLALDNVQRTALVEQLVESVAVKRARVAELEADVAAAKAEHEQLLEVNTRSLFKARSREEEVKRLKAMIGVAQRVDEDALRFATLLQEKLRHVASCASQVRAEVLQVRAATGQQRTESLGSDADRKLFELRLKVKELSTTLEISLQEFYGPRRLRSAIARDDVRSVMSTVRPGESRWLFETCGRRECAAMRSKVFQLRQQLGIDDELGIEK
jgi:hypothetical protein